MPFRCQSYPTVDAGSQYEFKVEYKKVLRILAAYCFKWILLHVQHCVMTTEKHFVSKAVRVVFIVAFTFRSYQMECLCKTVMTMTNRIKPKYKMGKTYKVK